MSPTVVHAIDQWTSRNHGNAFPRAIWIAPQATGSSDLTWHPLIDKAVQIKLQSRKNQREIKTRWAPSGPLRDIAAHQLLIARRATLPRQESTIEPTPLRQDPRKRRHLEIASSRIAPPETSISPDTKSPVSLKARTPLHHQNRVHLKERPAQPCARSYSRWRARVQRTGSSHSDRPTQSAAPTWGLLENVSDNERSFEHVLSPISPSLSDAYWSPYLSSHIPSSNKKARKLPNAPDKVLDAPNLINDYCECISIWLAHNWHLIKYIDIL